MIRAAASLFTERLNDYSHKGTRKLYGILCSVFGILTNLILFLIKLFASYISGSAAIAADAVHSLTDICSSLTLLVSFFLSERAERAAALLTGISLTAAGIKLIVSSFFELFEKTALVSTKAMPFLLLISVFVKLIMAYANGKYSVLLSSQALNAACADCLCDCISTASAIVAVVLSSYTDFNIDALGGILVSLFMFFSGIKIIAGFCLFFCRRS